MKTLKDLTPEIRAKIEDYKKEVRKFYDGIPFDRDASVKYIEKIYDIANRKKPIVIFAENPIQYKLYFSLLKKNVDIINKAFLIKNKCSNVDTNSNFVNREIDNYLDNQLCRVIRNRDLTDQLDNKLYSELRHGDLFGEIFGELYIELDSTLGDELSKELGDELGNDFNSYSKSHYLSFCSSYTRAYLCWYMFIMNEFDIPFSKKEMLEDLYYLFNKTSISRCYFTESYCLVLKNPSKIHFQDSLLHNIKGPAIDYNGKGDIYCIRGVRVEKEIFYNILSKNINFPDILKIKNEEEKSAFLYMIEELHGSEYFISIIKDHLKEMDTYVDKKNSLYLEGTTKGMNVGVYTLFKGSLDNIELSYVRCYCPSTYRMFFLGVDPVYDNAKDAIASLYRVPRKLKNEIVYLQRQGERYSTVFTKECMHRIEKGFYSKEDFEDTVSITGDEYFNKIRYEY